jgi:hypothetical protein
MRLRASGPQRYLGCCVPASAECQRPGERGATGAHGRIGPGRNGMSSCAQMPNVRPSGPRVQSDGSLGQARCRALDCRDAFSARDSDRRCSGHLSARVLRASPATCSGRAAAIRARALAAAARNESSLRSLPTCATRPRCPASQGPHSESPHRERMGAVLPGGVATTSGPESGSATTTFGRYPRQPFRRPYPPRRPVQRCQTRHPPRPAGPRARAAALGRGPARAPATPEGR